MKIRAVCPSCQAIFSRWFGLSLLPHLTYACPKCQKHFRLDPAMEWLKGMTGLLFLFLPLVLSYFGVLSFGVGVALGLISLGMCFVLAIAAFPYAVRICSAEPDAATTVDDRLRLLERSLRRLEVGRNLAWCFAAFGIVVGAISLVVLTDGRMPLRVKSLEVVDENGRPSVFLGTTQDGGAVCVNGRDGKGVARLQCLDSGDGAVELLSRQGGARCYLAADNDGGVLFLDDQYARRNIVIASNAGIALSDAELTLVNSKRQEVVVIGRDTEGGGLLEVSNALGGRLVTVGSTGSGGGIVDVYNSRSVRVATVQSGKNDAGLLSIENAEGSNSRVFSGKSR